MTNLHDPISEDEISASNAFEIVYQRITREWQILEERVNPSSRYYDAFHDRDAQERAHREASRSYDQSRLRAREWLREKLSQGAPSGPIALFWDPEKKKNQQIRPHQWASMGDLETMGVFETGILIVRGVRRTIFFNRKSFDDFMEKNAPPDGDRVTHPSESAPTASGLPAPGEVAVPGRPADGSPQIPDPGSVVLGGPPRSKLQMRIRALADQVQREGFVGRPQEFKEAIRKKFTGRKPHIRTIERALSDKPRGRKRQKAASDGK
jgi:hypothetical protein